MASETRDFVLSTGKVTRENLHWRRPLLIAIVTGSLTALCILTGHTSYAVPIAVGAWFTALSDTRQAFGVHWRYMAWTCMWLAIGATIGGFASTTGSWQLIIVGAMSLACGFAGALGGLGLANGSLTLVMYAIFAGAPVSDRTAGQTGLLVLAGGIISILVSLVVYLIGARSQLHEHRPAPDSIRHRLSEHLNLHDDYVWHSVRLAVAMVVATALSHALGWPHEYWIPMTVAWIARPGRRLTLERTMHRVLGTLAGIVVVIGLMLTAGYSQYQLAVLVAAGAGMTLIFIRANYTLAVTGITIAVLCLFAVEGQSLEINAPYRIAATLLAGAITALSALLWQPDNSSRSGNAAP
ncbi:MAG: FUSC family protein [Candidatus Nanopelagicales bacterium]